MLAELERAIDELEIPIDGAAIAEVFALRTRLDAALAEALAAFDRLALWDLDAATSLQAWLRTHAGLSRRAAVRTASVAKRVPGLPVTAAAWRDGRLSEGQVEAIVANVSSSTVGLFAEHEPRSWTCWLRCRSPTRPGPWGRGQPRPAKTTRSPTHSPGPCTWPRPSMVDWSWMATSTPRPVRSWPPPCAWPTAPTPPSHVTSPGGIMRTTIPDRCLPLRS